MCHRSKPEHIQRCELAQSNPALVAWERETVLDVLPHQLKVAHKVAETLASGSDVLQAEAQHNLSDKPAANPCSSIQVFCKGRFIKHCRFSYRHVCSIRPYYNHIR
jgi:hypothetical protein